MPNETWQSDFTHYRLTDRRHRRRRDPHLARRPLPLRPARHRPPPGHRPDRARHLPQSRRPARHPRLHADRQRHGLHHPLRPAAAAAATASSTELARLGIVQKNSRPNHPTTCGKVERFQQTMKNWLRAQPDQPATIAELQTLLDASRTTYNHHRPHRSLPHRATPATALQRPAQSQPGAQPRRRHPRPRPPRPRRQHRQRHPARHTAGSTTSASAEPTPEPTSSCSSTTSTSASSTPPPANSSANSPSTPPATTSPPTTRNDTTSPNPRSVGSGFADVLRHHMAVAEGFEPSVGLHQQTLSRRSP